MKNELRFAGFLVSRFKWLSVYVIGLIVLVFSIVGETFVPDKVLFYGVNFYLSVGGLALMLGGVWLRRNSKNPKTNLNPS